MPRSLRPCAGPLLVAMPTMFSTRLACPQARQLPPHEIGPTTESCSPQVTQRRRNRLGISQGYTSRRGLSRVREEGRTYPAIHIAPDSVTASLREGNGPYEGGFTAWQRP